MSFSLIVPTLNPGPVWVNVLRSIKLQTAVPERVLIIDSGSTDNTLAMSEDAGFEVNRVEKSTFDHGGTRQLAFEMCADSDYVIFMTQDAILADDHAFEQMMLCFEQSGAAAVCGRQLPRRGAGPIEAHARLYNYPEISMVRSASDIARLGLKAAFLSNSFAAYRTEALKFVSGFPRFTIFGEDMVVAAKLLKSGYSVAYASDAQVYHSHAYSLVGEFRRYFDMGVFHARDTWLQREFGRVEGEGARFVRSEARYLIKNNILLIPEAFLRTMIKYLGFRIGLQERLLPLSFKRKIAMNSGYFRPRKSFKKSGT